MRNTVIAMSSRVTEVAESSITFRDPICLPSFNKILKVGNRHQCVHFFLAYDKRKELG